MAAHGVETILVGVDGSEDSAEAVRFTADPAAALGAEVVAVHALGLFDQLEPGGPQVPTQPHRREIAEKIAGEWSQPLAEGGVAHRAVLHDGNADEGGA